MGIPARVRIESLVCPASIERIFGGYDFESGWVGGWVVQKRKGFRVYLAMCRHDTIEISPTVGPCILKMLHTASRLISADGLELAHVYSRICQREGEKGVVAFVCVLCCFKRFAMQGVLKALFGSGFLGSG